MTFFFDPAQKTATLLTTASLTLDKSFLIGLSSDEPNFAQYEVRFPDGSGKVAEMPAHGSKGIRKFHITPKVPGAHNLAAFVAPDRMSAAVQSVLHMAVVVLQVKEPKETAEDMVYTGAKLIWFHNLPKGSPGALEFKASSGNDHDSLGDGRNSAFQRMMNHGPVPEGIYRLLARRVPHRLATIINSKGDLDTLEGIEILPHDKRVMTYPGWGSHRVRLTPEGWNAAPNRGGFYLHDSHKGFSHGCIEVPDLFDALIPYADSHQKPENLRVRVTYSRDDVSTIGDTLRATVEGEYDAPAPN